jgi:hypothetical protein
MDISSRMKRRAILQYGSVSTDNASLVRDDPALYQHWVQVEALKKFKNQTKNSERIFGNRVSGICGVCDVVQPHQMSAVSQLNSSDGASTGSYTTTLAPVKLLTHELENTLYTSSKRKYALRFCGWDFYHSADVHSIDLEKFISSTNRTQSAGAALALFSGRFRRCLTYLDDIKDAGFALALTGYVGGSDEWKDRCRALKVADPYLRAMFGFLADPKDPEKVLKNDQDKTTGFPTMRLEDHVAFACLLLPDDVLVAYLENLSRKFTDRGELSGCLLTGIGPRTVELLSNYLDRTCDVQTVVLTILEANKMQVLQPHESSLISDWIDQYRALLDCWRLFELRALFDIRIKDLARDIGGANRQIMACCGFCNKPIISAYLRPMRGKRNMLQQDRDKMIHACPNCQRVFPFREERVTR